MLTVKRHELKYFLNYLEYHSLARRLGSVIQSDKYSEPGTGYFIRSLYFDSHDDECLFEKQGGHFVRKKYRLRIYDPATETVKFEIKNKSNNQIYKESATISKESAVEIINGNYGEFLRYDLPVLNKAYSVFTQKNYRPKVVIDYMRDAYVFDFFNIRITFDKDLRSSNTDFDIFSKNVCTIPVIHENKLILEIKYNECLPDYIRSIIQPDSFERYAISKYTLGRRFLKMSSWEDN